MCHSMCNKILHKIMLWFYTCTFIWYSCASIPFPCHTDLWDIPTQPPCFPEKQFFLVHCSLDMNVIFAHYRVFLCTIQFSRHADSRGVPIHPQHCSLFAGKHGGGVDARGVWPIQPCTTSAAPAPLHVPPVCCPGHLRQRHQPTGLRGGWHSVGQVSVIVCVCLCMCMCVVCVCVCVRDTFISVTNPQDCVVDGIW